MPYKDPERDRERRREYRKRHKDRIREYMLLYHKKNKDRILEVRRHWARSDSPRAINSRLADNLRIRMRQALKGGYKAGSAVSDLGCSIEYLRGYLAGQFEPGMSWENHGRNGWHIDHIKPLASFDLADREQFLQANHYTNLQPLWAADNRRKGAS